MWKKVALVSLSLWLVTLGTAGYFFYFGKTREIDKRIEVVVSAEEKNMILEEMRGLLQGLQKIIKAVSVQDFKEVAVIARSKGMVMASESNHHPGLFAKLPFAFKRLGLGVHQSFDRLADRAHQLQGHEILQETATIMNSCVACHATFRLGEEATKLSPAPASPFR